MPAAKPGRKFLYIPEELLDWSADGQHENLDQRKYPSQRPLSNQPQPSFPIPPPPVFSPAPRSDVEPLPYGPLTTTVLAASSVRTGNAVSTMPAASVINLLEEERLAEIRFSDNILARLAKYALAPRQMLLNRASYAAGHIAMKELPGVPSSSWKTTANRAAVPWATNQSRAIHRLATEYVVQRLRKPVAVNGELAIQVQFHSQVAQLINVWLQTRYKGISGDASLAPNRKWELPRGLDEQGRRAIIKSLYYPHWGFPVPKDHIHGLQASQLDQPMSAGLADFLFYVDRDEATAVGEIKTWWVLTTDELENYFEDTEGIFDWHPYNYGASAPRCLMQLWGELHAVQCRMAFLCNGRHVVFAFKTGPQQLTFSDFISWNDPQLHLVFMGFSMLAADAALCQKKVGGTSYDAKVLNKINLICRPDEMRSTYR